VQLLEYARFETAILAHVDDSYYYGAYCRQRKHSASGVRTKERIVDIGARYWPTCL
jgi:hypothetical protein